MHIEQVKFKRLSDKAILPTRGSEFSAGLDLYASIDIVILKKSYGAVKTDIAVAIPEGYYGRIAGRSGLAFKNGINTIGGVVDSDYRGELMVALVNHSLEDLEVLSGHKIAQLVIEKIISPEPVWSEDLAETARGSDGFGSTGK